MNKKKSKEYMIKVSMTLTNGEEVTRYVATDHDGNTRIATTEKDAARFKYVSSARKRIQLAHGILLQEPSIEKYQQELIEVSTL